MAITLERGQVFAGDFRIERRLGEGGMGSVYVATQLSTSATRALKLMNVDLTSGGTFRRRFEQEARVSAAIRSDHVVQVVAAGVDEPTLTPWLAMELLEGETLSQLAARQGPLPPALLAELYLQLCHALAAAHAVGIVHRDLKPDNIFVARPQRPREPFTVKVLDFGIAKMIAESSTKSTEPLGTPLWMSPEQTQHDRVVTPATDVWALGLIAFFLLTGKFYWHVAGEATNAVMLLRQIVMDPLPPASERAREFGVGHLLPPGFDAWFARAVARDPAARFRDAAEAHAALASFLGGGNLGPIEAVTVANRSSADLTGTSTTPHVSVRPMPTPFEANTTMAPAMSLSGAAQGGAPKGAPKGSAALYAVIVLGVLVLAGGGALAYLKLGQDKVDASTTPPAHSSLPTDTSAATPPSAQPSSGPRNASVPAPSGPAPSASAPTTHATDHPATPAPTASAKALPPFNETIARQQVDFTKNNAWICLRQGDPPTPVGGTVTFIGATGRVKTADVQADFALQGCIKGIMFGVSVPAFSGPDRSVAFAYTIKRP